MKSTPAQLNDLLIWRQLSVCEDGVIRDKYNSTLFHARLEADEADYITTLIVGAPELVEAVSSFLEWWFTCASLFEGLQSDWGAQNEVTKMVDALAAVGITKFQDEEE